MGQKVNPHGLRVGVIKDWDSRWYARNEKVGDLLVEDKKIRDFLKKKEFDAGVPKIEIERSGDKVRVYLHCARPGVVIGKGGEEVTRLQDEVAALIGKLRTKFPQDRILNYLTIGFFWINFVLSCGGQLFDSRDPGKVTFDSPKALEGFRIARELVRPAGARNLPLNESAIMIIDRQTLCRIRKEGEMKDGWLYLPIPGNTPGRTGISMQATELFAVRRGSLDRDLIAPIIRFLWSKKFQDHLASLHYGIPIRKSSAEKSFAGCREPDSLFERYCPQICNEYRVSDPDLMLLICRGVYRILERGAEPDRQIAELAEVIRKYIEYRW